MIIPVIDLPQVSLEWVLIGFIQFIMRSHNKLDRPYQNPFKRDLGQVSDNYMYYYSFTDQHT